MVYGVNGSADNAPVRICKVDCSQAVIGGGAFVDHHVSRRLLGVRYPLYPAPHLAQGLICAGGRYIRHVESILADVDEFARDSTHMRGFSTVSVRFHVRRKAAVAELFCAANVHSLLRRSARHFRTMLGNAHPPWSFGRWSGCGDAENGTIFSLRGKFVHIEHGEGGTSFGRMLFAPAHALH